jgi:hypothetical protein
VHNLLYLQASSLLAITMPAKKRIWREGGVGLS